MHGPSDTVYPAVDFIRGPGGRWFDAVTGRSAEVFPEASRPDPDHPGRRLVLGPDDGHGGVVVAEYKRSPCGAPKEGGTTDSAEPPDEARLGNEVLDEINAARTDPLGYATRLGGSNDPDVLEAADFLRRQSRLSPLRLHVALLMSATRHAVDQGRFGKASHVGTDGSTVRERVTAAGARPALVGEEIAFDADSGMGVTRQLLVDHGVPDRGHRAILFNASLAYVGVACNPHAAYKLICVIDVSGPIVGR